MSQLSVSLVRADTNQEFDVELPDDAKVAELLPALVKELGLPVTGPDGDQIAYELSNKRTGREYQEGQSLGDAGTLAGDLLLLTSTFVAGAQAPTAGAVVQLAQQVLRSYDDGLPYDLAHAVLDSAEKAHEDEPSAQVVSYDWKSHPIDDDGNGPLGEALRALGIHIALLPSDRHSDQYGFVLSKRALSPDEVCEADAKHLGVPMEVYAEDFPRGEDD